MKKILLALLLLPSIAYADTITSGSIGLVQPSTGAIPSRNWGSSLNSNFQVIANTLTTVLNNLSTVSSDTSTIISLIKSTSVALSNQINTYNTFTSTTQSDLNIIRSSMVAIRQSTSSFQSTYNNFTSTTQSDLDVIRSSMVIIRQSTSTFQSTYNTFTSTTQSDLEIIRSSMVVLRQSTSTLEGVVAGRTQVWNEEGSILTGGDVTSINCVGGSITCNQSNSTVTLTVTASGGSGVRSFTVVVGTLGAIASEVDIASSNIDGLYAALARLEANGLAYSTTGHGTILYRPGVYDIKLATIPAGVTLYAIPGSSTVWIMSNAAQGILTNYGTVDGITFDLSSKAYSAIVINNKSNSVFRNNKIFNINEMSVLNTPFFSIQNATNVYVTNNRFAPFRDRPIFNDSQRSGPFQISFATHIFIRNNIFEGVTGRADGDSTGIVIARSLNVFIENNDIQCSDHGCIGLVGDAIGVHVDRNDILVKNAASPTRGIFYIWAFDDSVPVAISTGSTFNYNTIVVTGTISGGNALICVGQCNDGNQANNLTYGFHIAGNHIKNFFANSLKVIDVEGTNVINTVIQNNTVFGTWGAFIQDGGSNTKYTSLGNIYNSTEQ